MTGLHAASGAASEAPSGEPVALVIDPGSRTTLQDHGRRGFAHLGVPGSGPVDRAAFWLGNRLAGNSEDAPALETTLRGPTLRFTRAATIVLTGAPVDAQLDGRPVAMHAPIAIRGGQTLVVGTATHGLRTYVALRGGFDAPRTLGSVSNDELTGLGTPPLAAGDTLRAGDLALDQPAVDVAPVAAAPRSPTLRVVLGPREEWFAPDAVTALLTEPFTVTSSVNRIGARLDGPNLPHREDAQLRSEGVVAGALQVPPSGNPILLLADHPTTGGYPVIAVVVSDDLPLVAQARPGDKLRFSVALFTPPVADPHRLP